MVIIMNNRFRVYLFLMLGLVVLGVGLFLYFRTDEKVLPSEVEEQNEILYFWYTDEAMSDYYNLAATTFNKENQGITIYPNLIEGTEFIEKIYKASNAKKDAPDIYITSNDTLEKAYLAGIAKPIVDDEIVADFPKTAIDAVTYNGQIVGYPYYYETSTFIYNKSILEEIAYNLLMTPEPNEEEEETQEVEFTPYKELLEDEKASLMPQIKEKADTLLPKTVDELLSLANTITAPEGMEYLFKWDINDIFFNYFYVGAYMNVGGPQGDNSDNIDIYNDNAVKGLEVFQQLTTFFYIDADEVSREKIIDEFLEGKVLFSIVDSDSANRLELAKSDEENPLNFEYGYSLVPNPSKEIEGKSLSVTQTVVINGYSKKAEEAKKFAKFLVDGYTSNLYEKTKKLTTNQTVEAKTELEKNFREEYNKSMPMPKMLATNNFWMHLENVFSDVWRGADIKLELEKLQEKIKNQIP